MKLLKKAWESVINCGYIIAWTILYAVCGKPDELEDKE